MARPTTSSDRKKAAAEATKKASKETTSRHAGRSYLRWSGDRHEPKGGVTSLLTFIPYEVKEKRHPDGRKEGELWYKRPFWIHRGMGLGDDAKTMVCPKSFHSRSSCAPCEEAARLSKEDYDKNRDAIMDAKSSHRDLYLVYDHDAKKIQLLDISWFLFGKLLDSRIENARPNKAEDWAAFWLDGADGMALEVTWATEKLGKNEFVKASAIDFVPREEAPVPDRIWGEAVELSTLLIQTSSKDIEAAYYQLPPEGEEEEREKEPEPPRRSRSDTRINKDEEENPEPPKKEPTSRRERTSRSNEPEEKKEEKSNCPFGHKFGDDFNETDDCKNCDDENYNACSESCPF